VGAHGGHETCHHEKWRSRLFTNRRLPVLWHFIEHQAVGLPLQGVRQLLQVLTGGTNVLERLVQVVAVSLHRVIEIHYQPAGVDQRCTQGEEDVVDLGAILEDYLVQILG